MAAAAVVLSMGGDPSWVLDCEIEDWPIAMAIINKAADQQTRYDRGMADYVSARTSNGTVSGLSKFLRSMFYAWASANKRG